jgi:hypothetical protein
LVKLVSNSVQSAHISREEYQDHGAESETDGKIPGNHEAEASVDSKVAHDLERLMRKPGNPVGHFTQLGD